MPSNSSNNFGCLSLSNAKDSGSQLERTYILWPSFLQRFTNAKAAGDNFCESTKCSGVKIIYNKFLIIRCSAWQVNQSMCCARVISINALISEQVICPWSHAHISNGNGLPFSSYV